MRAYGEAAHPLFFFFKNTHSKKPCDESDIIVVATKLRARKIERVNCARLKHLLKTLFGICCERDNCLVSNSDVNTNLVTMSRTSTAVRRNWLSSAMGQCMTEANSGATIRNAMHTWLHRVFAFRVFGMWRS